LSSLRVLVRERTEGFTSLAAMRRDWPTHHLAWSHIRLSALPIAGTAIKSGQQRIRKGILCCIFGVSICSFSTGAWRSSACLLAAQLRCTGKASWGPKVLTQDQTALAEIVCQSLCLNGASLWEWAVWDMYQPSILGFCYLLSRFR